jgi:glycosyltransferase involved in cell wall biosynthesis
MADPIFVEVTNLMGGHITGIGRFAARVVEALAKVASVRLVCNSTWELAVSQRMRTDLLAGQEIAVTSADLPAAGMDLMSWTRRLLKLPKRAHDPRCAERCAAVYTCLRQPARHFRKEMLIIHDFTPQIVPWAHTPLTVQTFGTLFGKTAKLCDKLVANSHSTKADARWLCAVPPDDVVVCYPGPSLCPNYHLHTRPVTKRSNVLLVVATLEPRKNLPFLFDWFQKTTVLPPGMELWWVGAKGWWCPNNWSTLVGRKWGNARKFRFLGAVSDKKLCRLYQQAAVSIYPSLYEGFGFPVLDSLNHRTPVACSYNSSLKEFACPGVFYFDPCAAETLDKACLEALAFSPSKIDQPDLRRRYSWDKFAQTVLALSA